MKPELSKKLIETREQTLSVITNFFTDKALEGHVFGSLARGDGDALSDIDVWVTFKDDEIQESIKNRFEIYKRFGTILICHEAQQNFPLGGNYSLVIYDTPAGLLQVDYFFCPLSSSRVDDGAIVLFGKTPIQKGKMVYDPKRTKKDPSDKLSFVICMCFVAIKKIVRKDPDFMPFLVSEYVNMKKDLFPQLPAVENVNSLKTLNEMLKNLETVATPEQGMAIGAIRRFSAQVGFK